MRTKNKVLAKTMNFDTLPPVMLPETVGRSFAECKDVQLRKIS